MTSAPPPAAAPPAPAPTTPAETTASWVIGTCFVDRGQPATSLTGTVLVRNDDATGTHSYQVTVAFGASRELAEQTVVVPDVGPGDTGSVDLAAAGTPPGNDPTVPCEITKVVDENNRTPHQGPALAPPPDRPPANQPTPTTPPPTPSEPVPPSGPPQVSPSPS